MDPRSDRAGPSIYIYPQGILVNQHGQRFVDEGPGPTDETYEGVTREINAQPGGIAYAILDTTLAKVKHPESVVRSEVPPYQSDTLAGLAAQLKIDADALEATVAAYNRACGKGIYDEANMDGLCTRGISPRKSNWARPIEQPPYIAFPIISSVVLTFGGLRVTPRAQVVNQQGDVIPGMYAAGETLGLYYRSYTGATSVLKGLVFGSIAGADAAKVPRA
jgi:tricarballylate dehydrogenase